MGTLSDVKTNAQLLKGRVDNVSTLSSEIKRTRGGMEAAGVQIQMVNASLDHIHSHIRRLETDVKKANAQIQMLMKSWEEVDDLNAQIPQLKNDLDKASALNTKVRALQSSLENTSKLLKRQSKWLRKECWKLISGPWDLASLSTCGGKQERRGAGMAGKLRREGWALGLGRT